MDDEPLSAWAKRRDAKIGRLRSVPISSDAGPKGSHLNPDAPRAIERWNGHAWEPYGFAADLAEAKRVLYPDVGEPAVPTQPHKALGDGTGKHRKPPTPKSGLR